MARFSHFFPGSRSGKRPFRQKRCYNSTCSPPPPRRGFSPGSTAAWRHRGASEPRPGRTIPDVTTECELQRKLSARPTYRLQYLISVSSNQLIFKALGQRYKERSVIIQIIYFKPVHSNNIYMHWRAFQPFYTKANAVEKIIN